MSLPSIILKGNEQRHIFPLQWLILYHFAFGIAFYFFTRNGGGDAWGYWQVARQMSFEDFQMFLLHSNGTRFMEAFNYLFANVLGMGFFANTMLFTFFGSVGVVCFYVVAIRTTRSNVRYEGFNLIPTLFYLPNLHFWSSGVGKDTILFMCIGLFAYGLLNMKRRLVLIGIAIILSLAIRPHITLFLLLAFGFAYILDGRIAGYQKISFSILFFLAGILIMPQVLDFIRVESLNTDIILKRAEIQSKNLAEGAGSAIDTNSYPLLIQIFTFLYRPLFFDASSFGALLSSFDNLLLLTLSILTFSKRPIYTFSKAPVIVKGFLIFGIIGTLAFSPTLGNLGIMIRQKNMFTPGILIYFLWAFYLHARLNYMRNIQAYYHSLKFLVNSK